MPDPETCAKRFKPGTQAYDDCVGYKGAKKPKVKGNLADEMSRVRSKGGN